MVFFRLIHRFALVLVDSTKFQTLRNALGYSHWSACHYAELWNYFLAHREGIFFARKILSAEDTLHHFSSHKGHRAFDTKLYPPL